MLDLELIDDCSQTVYLDAGAVVAVAPLGSTHPDWCLVTLAPGFRGAFQHHAAEVCAKVSTALAERQRAT